MPSVTFEICVILGLILVNGIFAMSEIAVVTAKKARLKKWAEEGSGSAQTALDMARNPNRFLSTVQVGITLVGIIAGAYGGANLTAPLSKLLEQYAFIAPYVEEVAYLIVVCSITYFTLIIGELVPKRIGLYNPERLAQQMARPMYYLSLAAAPVVWVLSHSTNIMVRFLRLRGTSEPSVTTQEIRIMLAEGIKEGTVEEEEHDIIKRLFRFGDQDVGAVMTPRREIVGIDLDATPKENRQTILTLSHARLVAYRGNLDEAAGIIHVRSVLARLLADEPLNLSQAVKPVRFVSEHTSALKVLKYFRQTGEKIVLIVDEYGGVDGLITLDDILEAIVGDIPWEGESLEPDIIEREDGTWLIDGMVTTEEFRDLLNLQKLPGAEEGDFRTVGGWVTSHLDRIPAADEQFDWNHYRFRVINMDGSRVDKILVKPLEEDESEEEE